MYGGSVTVDSWEWQLWWEQMRARMLREGYSRGAVVIVIAA